MKLSRSIFVTGAAVAIAAAGAAWFLAGPQTTLAKDSATPAVEAAAGQSAVAGAGRIEPASEEIRIGSELDGRLKRVAVEEGDRVQAGQVVAELENGDYIARVSLAKANIAQQESLIERLVNGSRKQERSESSAAVREAQAVVDNARVERDRRRTLLERGAISRTELDTAEREFRVAQARLEAVEERRALVDDQTRPEDLTRARAELDAARARLYESEAMLAKTIIRSPIAGTVLRKKLKTGESVSNNGSSPIVTLGDTSRLRVRMDVDENDIARIAVGRSAWVIAPAYGATRKFTGKVVEIGQALGRKNVRTDEPTERVDVKILETLIELDPGQTLPVGLRVDAYIAQK
ncbi:hemolysin secretion protein D [Bryobacterales bacterium F-183]|nr:hemolysin secretion protein D [Bryobacterales bacterium F-183]